MRDRPLTQSHPCRRRLVIDPERDPGQHDDQNGREISNSFHGIVIVWGRSTETICCGSQGRISSLRATNTQYILSPAFLGCKLKSSRDRCYFRGPKHR
ncbi:hypothetical protein PoB_005213000 [Plakobranchus ocellatus]|uniref:Uncharacterized protein n=1 Tax=Plakobranchus ocellatus TaxID=259542 RepID=A0AAV4C1W9_9GAST|nr:hypothetical protein PoB_005213000 [Plakobranchus ocellatus]